MRLTADSPFSESPPNRTALPCFHCGQSCEGRPLVANYQGEDRNFCCVGCEAVARLINEEGLDRFYQFRHADLPRAAEFDQRDHEFYRLHDRPEILERISQPAPEGARRIHLGIEGITCAACVWLIERHLRRLTGVNEVLVSLSAERAEIHWLPDLLPLSRLLEAIHELGYRPYPFTPVASEKRRQKALRQNILRMGIAGLGAMQSMMLAIPLYLGLLEVSGSAMEQLFRWMSLLITTPVVLYSAQPFYASAWRALSQRTLNMDVPVSLAIATAYLASLWVTLSGGGEVYFDSVCMFAFFLLVARQMEQYSRHAALGKQHLERAVQPGLTRRVTANGSTEPVLIEQIRIGDRIRMLQGEQCPVDGVILEGNVAIDTAVLTGESRPLSCGPGESVAAGAFFVDGGVDLEATRTASDSTLHHIEDLTLKAENQRSALHQRSDRIAAWFLAIVLSGSLLVGLFWWNHDPDRAFAIVLSVWVATCPCALSLAVPAAIANALRGFRRLGLIIVRSEAVEGLARIRHVVFDKTGTLTTGQIGVASVLPAPEISTAEILSLAAGMNLHSSHPVGRALRQAASERNLEPRAFTDIRMIPGAGVEGRLKNDCYRLGNAAFTAMAHRHQSDHHQVFLTCENRLLGEIRINDALRSEMSKVCTKLQTQGFQLHILSGDHHDRVQQIGSTLGIDDARGGLSPEAKMAAVNALRQKESHGQIAMVGDGINDLPALAAADVSLAVTNATDFTRARADALLMESRLNELDLVLDHARRSRRIVRQNLIWALSYNFTMLPLAAAGWVAPWAAALGMSLSSLIVTLNATRLRKHHE